MTIINLTERQMRDAENPFPCDHCQMGFGSIGQWRDLQTGDLMQESKDCSETCKILRDYLSKNK